MAWTHRPMPPVPTPPPLSRLRRRPADTNTNANGRRKPPLNTKTTARTTPASAGSPLHLEPRPSPHRPRGMRAYVKGRNLEAGTEGRHETRTMGLSPSSRTRNTPRRTAKTRMRQNPGSECERQQIRQSGGDACTMTPHPKLATERRSNGADLLLLYYPL